MRTKTRFSQKPSRSELLSLLTTYRKSFKEPIIGLLKSRWRGSAVLIIVKSPYLNEQELSYRQQIARQLRTQYAESIYRLKYYNVTLKSRLRVAHGHWKRNHWIDHTRLNSSRVI